MEGRQYVGRLLEKMSSELVIRRAFIWPLGGTVMDIRLELLKQSDEEQFIKDNQAAFNFGAEQYFTEKELEEQHEEDGQIISKETIVESIHRQGSITYRILDGDKKVGGIIINLKDDFGELEIFFVIPNSESKGVGQIAWQEVERLHPEIKVWETVTPYFEQRNIHFYVNKLGFHIVEFYNKFLKDKDLSEGMDGMFRFQKVKK